MKAAQHLMKVLNPKVSKVKSQRRGVLPSSEKGESFRYYLGNRHAYRKPVHPKTV